MIWLIGNQGMLGQEVELLLENFRYLATDQAVDITDYELLERYARENYGRITHIVNCAAYTLVDRAETEEARAYSVNALGALNVARIAAALRATVIHISSDYVFDGRKKESYREDDPASPLSVYGKTKLQGERYVAENCPKYFIIRTAWLYGRHGKNFVYTMLDLFGKRDLVKVVSDQWGTPTYTKDLAHVIVHLIQNPGHYGVYHFTNEGKATWYDFACRIYQRGREYHLIEREVRILPITSSEYGAAAPRPGNSILCKEKIRREFSLSIRDWQNGLDEFLRDLAEIGKPVQ